MIKVFIPEIKGRIKTSVRGFWYSQDTKRTYYDYLKVKDYSYTYNRRGFSYTTLKRLKALKLKYKQEALFFINNQSLGYILNNDLTIIELKKVIRFSIGKDKKNLKGIIKKLLRDYKGLTIYIEPEGYILEVYHK